MQKFVDKFLHFSFLNLAVEIGIVFQEKLVELLIGDFRLLFVLPKLVEKFKSLLLVKHPTFIDVVLGPDLLDKALSVLRLFGLSIIFLQVHMDVSQ